MKWLLDLIGFRRNRRVIWAKLNEPYEKLMQRSNLRQADPFDLIVYDTINDDIELRLEYKNLCYTFNVKFVAIGVDPKDGRPWVTTVIFIPHLKPLQESKANEMVEHLKSIGLEAQKRLIFTNEYSVVVDLNDFSEMNDNDDNNNSST